MIIFFIFQIEMVRIKYNGGDWYNDPTIIPNMMIEFEKRTGIKTSKEEVVLTLDDPRIFYYPFIFITGHEKIFLSDKEIENLRKYLWNGGFLYVDDDYGMDEYIRRELMKVFPANKLIPIPKEHRIYNCFYKFPEGLPKIHEHYKGPPQGYGIFLNGRMAVFYTYNSNISDGWNDPDVYNDPPEKREEAFRMGVNIIYYSLTE
uniref:DUF4159 domain-containing protein n=1 Tax=candidate division WOR-3 bacterium TaxID=2052148 RepID=A0A7C4YJ69_UNCW3